MSGGDLNLTLVGRERQAEVLNEAYEKCCWRARDPSDPTTTTSQTQELEQPSSSSSSSSSQIVWVSGGGGTGKSTLIRQTLQRKKNFCYGKFDRLKPAHVFPALVSLLADIGRCLQQQKLAKPPSLLRADEVRLLVKLVPGLRSVLSNLRYDDDPSTGSIGGGWMDNSSTKNDTSSPTATSGSSNGSPKEKWKNEKLKQAILSFLRVTIQVLEEPLIMFFDDLQYADEDTLGILQAIIDALLMDSDSAVAAGANATSTTFTISTTNTNSSRQEQTIHNNILFIGAYRENEIDRKGILAPYIFATEDHQRVEASSNNHQQVTRLMAGNLSQDDTHRLVLQVLGFNATACDEKSPSHSKGPIASLSEIIYSKTQGNALFILYLMKHIYDRKILRHDDNHGWSCGDLDMVKKEVNQSDDIAEFLVQKLNSMPEPILTALQIAACIGGQVKVDLLRSVLQQHRQQPSAGEAEAVRRHDQGGGDGLLSLEDILETALTEQLIEMDHNHTTFQFAHDRIQSAAYSMVEENRKQALHLMIGRCLHETLVQESAAAAAAAAGAGSSPTSDDDEAATTRTTADDAERRREARNLQLVVVADQIQRGRKFIEEVGREKLVELNLQAATILAETGSFKVAETFLENGIEVLSLRRWDEHYELALELYSFLAWVQYANGKMQESLATIRDIYLYAKSIEDQYEARYIHVQVLASSNRLIECLQQSNLFLKDLHHPKLPNDAGLIHIIPNMIRVDGLLKGKTDEDLVSLPMCTDPEKMATMCHLAFLTHVAFFAGKQTLIPVIACRVMQISLLHGIGVHTPYSFASYAFSQTVTGNYDRAVRFANLALRLTTERFPNKDVQTLFIVYGLLHHIRHPIHECGDPTLSVYNDAFAQGDLSTAGQAANLYIWAQIGSGKELGQIIDQNITFTSQMDKYNQDLWYKSTLTLLRYLSELAGRSDDIIHLTRGHKMNDYQFESFLAEGGNADMTLFGYWMVTMMVRFYLGDQKSALRFAEKCWKGWKKRLQGALCYCVPYFLFSALTALDQWRETSCLQRRKYWRIFCQFRSELKLWLSHGGNHMNCEHLILLLKAEWKAVVVAKQDIVKRAYEESIALALSRGFHHDAALIHERFSKYLLSIKDVIGGIDHVQSSLRLYQQWGAQAKVEQMNTIFGDVLVFSQDDEKDCTGTSLSSRSSPNKVRPCKVETKQSISKERS